MTNTLFQSNYLLEKTTNGLVHGWKFGKIFADIIGIVLLAAAIFAYSNYQQYNRMQIISAPNINDFYFVDYHSINPSSDNRFRYLPLKISAIEDDMITFKVGNIGFTEQVAITEHVKFDMAIKPIFYREHDLTVSMQTIRNWAEKEIIYDIARPDNIYINGWIVMHLNELPEDQKVSVYK